MGLVVLVLFFPKERAAAGLGCPTRTDVERLLWRALAEVLLVVSLLGGVVEGRKSSSQGFPRATLTMAGGCLEPWGCQGGGLGVPPPGARG